MKRIILFALSLMFMLTSCLTIEKVDGKNQNVIDTTIIKTDSQKQDIKIDTSNTNTSKTDLENKTNQEILSDKNAINKVFDRNKRKYNYNLKGLWVASVNNLDFPSDPGKSVNELKQEVITILNNAKSWGINAIFYQVKPGADAMYDTNFWPTSRYLTGYEGKSLGYDILPFFIQEAHKRGIEFHAWINPYRASQSKDLSLIANNSIVKRRPDWTFVYGNKLFLNPGNPEVVEYVSKSIEEIVRKYDIDGIHLDDYFYPYPEDGQMIPDQNEFEKYGKNFSNIEDWRRNNVNEMIKNLSVSVHKIKPSIVFGVSPFGIWRNIWQSPKGSYTNGLASYDNLYADSILWMEKGWIDYIAPQIYWNIGKKGSDYETLAKWWSNEAQRTDTLLYIGQGIYKYSNKEKDHWNNFYELRDQLQLNKTLKGVNGSIFFRYGTFVNHPEIIDQLKEWTLK